METRLCGACGQDVPDNEFGKHVDGHSDSELERWPGGLKAAVRAVQESREAGRKR